MLRTQDLAAEAPPLHSQQLQRDMTSQQDRWAGGRGGGASNSGLSPAASAQILDTTADLSCELRALCTSSQVLRQNLKHKHISEQQLLFHRNLLQPAGGAADSQPGLKCRPIHSHWVVLKLTSVE